MTNLVLIVGWHQGDWKEDIELCTNQYRKMYNLIDWDMLARQLGINASNCNMFDTNERKCAIGLDK